MGKYFTRGIEGCAECGVDKRSHCQLWKSGIGWHVWIEPSKELIRYRMRNKYGLG